MSCLKLWPWTDNIVISERVYVSSVGYILIVTITRIDSDIEDPYIGVLCHTFYCNKRGYCNFCRDIAYSSLYWEYRYFEDRYIGALLYFTCAFRRKENVHVVELATSKVIPVKNSNWSLRVKYWALQSSDRSSPFLEGKKKKKKKTNKQTNKQT